jgi:hypothetical protein
MAVLPTFNGLEWDGAYVRVPIMFFLKTGTFPNCYLKNLGQFVKKRDMLKIKKTKNKSIIDYMLHFK